MYKIAIIGGRDFDDYDLMVNTLKDFKIKEIISGGANGADKLAEKYAQENDIPITIFLPEWNVYGGKAGMIRNKQIVDKAERIVAFWDGESRGTKNSIELGTKQMKQIRVVKY